jgi:hypothetical protein
LANKVSTNEKKLQLANPKSNDLVVNSKFFITAANELNQMLSDSIPINLKHAVFISENAYYNNTKNYQNFCKQVDSLVWICRQILKEKGFGEDNKMACNSAIQKLFADTIKYTLPNGKKAIFYPLTYDFDDCWCDKDFEKMFVTKLLNTKTGQCHSMPLLYLIIAQELKTDAYLTIAPVHSYIKFPVGNFLFSFECTNGVLTADDWIVASGYVSSLAVKNKIYLYPLTLKQTIAECLNDLGGHYQQRFGYDNFVTDCAYTALKYFPNCLSALQVIANNEIAICANKAKQYDFPSINKYSQFPELKMEFEKMLQLQLNVDATGFINIPKDVYDRWHGTLKEEKQRRESEQLKNKMTEQIKN